MAVTVSAAVLFGLVSLVLIRTRYVQLGSALVLFLFGFFIASTGASKPITSACQAIAQALTHLTA
ncbi:hypothetical protein CG747_26065 [Streptomyces sp. CB02959]|uniref:hypothetical protein n=1 Tax=Streptomyces sp. CB02959 TaxID=2020330 RepID=UPI000C27BC40|nr:hypothetical protein [Streptomyces sp. CB02959]PJN37957.1 hypothetical protein CG747_26065 [Streptomyces sp. CB02959]